MRSFASIWLMVYSGGMCREIVYALLSVGITWLGMVGTLTMSPYIGVPMVLWGIGRLVFGITRLR